MASGHVNRTQRPNTWLHRPRLRREDSPCQLGAVHTWPLTSFTALQKCRRYRINSGQTAPSGLTGSAAFDPFETLGRPPAHRSVMATSPYSDAPKRYARGGGGAGVRPWRRMISAIFARSGGPPAAALITSAELTEKLRTYRSRRDHAERLSLLRSVVIKPVNGPARDT